MPFAVPLNEVSQNFPRQKQYTFWTVFKPLHSCSLWTQHVVMFEDQATGKQGHSALWTQHANVALYFVPCILVQLCLTAGILDMHELL